ncbi:MAG: right-handed parallel beta-helix repeat-containing protein [Kofleriaceae bacterium]
MNGVFAMQRLALFVLGMWMLGATGCNKENPLFCEGPNADDSCPKPDSAPRCMSNGDCSGATPVCLLPEGTCVQCTDADHSACANPTPVCGDDHTCRGCEAHSECDAWAGVCVFADQSCAGPDQVAYVAPGGTGTPPNCDRGTPCSDLADALDANKELIKVAGGTIKDSGGNATEIEGRTVSIFGESSTVIDRDGDGSILVVKHNGPGTTNVSIYDLTISGASGAGANGINLEPNGGNPTLKLVGVKLASNEGFGIEASGGQLTMIRTNVTDNEEGGIAASGSMGSLMISRSVISSNQGGGIMVTAGTFVIRNNIIIYNGVPDGANATQTGGAVLVPNSTGSAFEQNTVAYNKNDGSLYRAGVTCGGANVMAGGNIVYKNTEAMTTSDATQRGGGCQFGNTLALGTSTGDLGFAQPTSSPFDFHLTINSPTSVRDAGGACTGEDFDGESRPNGNGCDLGADEFYP